jgi:hypothetical protein
MVFVCHPKAFVTSETQSAASPPVRGYSPMKSKDRFASAGSV